jgi:hypothetical protein
MSSIKLDEIIDKFPAEKRTIHRLESVLSKATPNQVYTFEHLYNKVSPSSAELLSLVLAELELRGILQKVIRLESPTTRGGLGDYSSIFEVPEVIRDWRSGNREIRVQPENLRVLFKVHG